MKLTRRGKRPARQTISKMPWYLAQQPRPTQGKAAQRDDKRQRKEERQPEYDHRLCEREHSESEQGELKPDHNRIVHQIEAEPVLRETIKNRRVRRGESQADSQRR